ncbi:hypothetical protein BHM03_00004775 [Ensete ventricosum]|nr:hypothetical protein BHM03_00004775 [Ensete ventricosum]
MMPYPSLPSLHHRPYAGGSPPAGDCPYGRLPSRGRHHHGRRPDECSCERPPLQATSSARRRLAYGHRARRRRPCGRLLPTFGSPCRKLAPCRGGREVVYPCILDPDREDRGGQASSSLAVSTRRISTAKLLQSDLVTLAQREGGEYKVVAKAAAYQP